MECECLRINSRTLRLKAAGCSQLIEGAASHFANLGQLTAAAQRQLVFSDYLRL